MREDSEDCMWNGDDRGCDPPPVSGGVEDEATPLLGALPGDILGASSGCAALDSMAINSSSTALSSTRDAAPVRRCSHRCVLRTLWICTVSPSWRGAMERHQEADR